MAEGPSIPTSPTGSWTGSPPPGAHAMGRVTYEEMSSFWPTSTDGFAKPMNEIPKVVFSKTLTRADWATTTIASGDLAEEVARLKAEPGGDVIVYGGYTLAQALTRANLVDEYRLVTRPVALGSGEPMFKDLPVGPPPRAGRRHGVPRRDRDHRLRPATRLTRAVPQSLRSRT